MAYTILNPDGSVLTLLADGRIDQSTTSLALVGKNTNGFGQYINENFVVLLANGANTSGNPPRNPLKGQTWYDTTVRKLKVYDNGFRNVAGVTVSSAYPVDLGSGDLWFDSVNMQLKILNGGILYVVGPMFSKSVGDNGWIIPPTSVKDINNTPQQVTVLKNYGNTIGFISQTQFTPSVADNTNYFSTSTSQKIVSGLTVNGDINYTGKSVDKQLSWFIDVDILANTINNISGDISIPANVGAQNNAIRTMLGAMFPPNSSNSPLDHLTQEFGLPNGSVCKVLVRYSQGGQNATSGGRVNGEGYQVRRFRINSVGTWEYNGTTELSL
jgi:hypothetical protein